MLCQGTEVYGIGTIEKLYAQFMPGLIFVCMTDGALAQWLREHQVDVRILEGGLEQFSAGGSVRTLLRLPRVWRQAKQDANRLHAMLAGTGVRIIHTQWLPQQLIAGHMRKLGYKVVWQINNNTNRRRLGGLGVKLNQCLARWGADYLLPASDFIGANWRDCGVPMMTIRNAAAPLLEKVSPLPPLPYKCLIAGRLEQSKGHDLAIEAILKCRTDGLDVRLDIYGGPVSGAYYEGLRSKVRAAGAEDFIQFRGFCEDLRRRHTEYHLGLQCRIDPEPCSLWVCETQVDGLPLIAAANGGTPELVREGVTGLLFESGNANDLKLKIKQAIATPGMLWQLRQQAFEVAQREMTVARFISQTESAYSRL